MRKYLLLLIFLILVGLCFTSSVNASSVTIHISENWNLISSPFEEPISLSEIAEQCDLWTSQGKVWSWTYNPEEEWSQPQEIKKGEGVWVLSKEDCDVTLTGTKATFSSKELKQGWNLFSTETSWNETKGDCVITSNPALWEYDSEAESWTHPSLTEKLDPSKGYWVAVKNDCTIGGGGSGSSGTGSISGRVVNLTDQPISGVSVEIPGKVDTTGADGRFSFTNLEWGPYTVTFSKEGYDDFSLLVNLHTDEHHDCFDIELTSIGLQPAPGKALVYGRVIEFDYHFEPPYAPVSGVWVQCGPVEAWTDEDGRYVCNNIDYWGKPLDGTRAFSTLFIKEGYYTETIITPILKAGDIINLGTIEMSSTSAPDGGDGDNCDLYFVGSIFLADERRTAATSMRVYLHKLPLVDPEAFRWEDSHDAGYFQFQHLCPGQYLLRTETPYYLLYNETITLTQGVIDHIVWLQPATTGYKGSVYIEGHVINAYTGNPVANAEVTLYFGSREVYTQSDGYYFFPYLPLLGIQGPYLSCTASGYRYYQNYGESLPPVNGPTHYDIKLKPI